MRFSCMAYVLLYHMADELSVAITQKDKMHAFMQRKAVE